MPTKVFAGEGERRRVGELAKQEGLKGKALVVTGKASMRRAGFLADVVSSLESAGYRVDVCEGVSPEPTDADVEMVAAKGRDAGFLVAIGGGSAIDVAKVASVVITHGGKGWDYTRGGKKTGKAITEKTLPVVAIPSTSGTGTEVTPFAVLMNVKDKVKDAVHSDYIYPRMSILDPEVTYTMSREITVITGLDAFAHSVEAIFSKRASSFAIATAMLSIKLVLEYLKESAERGTPEARRQMQEAAFLGGLAISQNGAVVGHAIGHVIGAEASLPHGLAVALALPHVPLLYANALQRLKYLAEALGAKSADPKELSYLLRDLCGELGLWDMARRHKAKIDPIEAARKTLTLSPARNGVFTPTESDIAKAIEAIAQNLQG